MSETTDQLRTYAEEAKAEFTNLEAEVAAIPGQLAELERRLKSSTDEKIIRTLIKKRSELKEAQEVQPLLLRGANIRWLRAESADARALDLEIRAGYAEAIAAEREAKAELEVATQKHDAATKHRATIERRSSTLHDRWQTVAAKADELERVETRAA